LTDLVPSELSPKMQKAAVLEAAGIRRQEIADTVGVSTKTLTAWAKREDFKLAVTAAAGSQLARLEGAVERLQQEAVDAANEAIDKLREAMEAVDEYDRPYHKIRLDAAIALLSLPAVRALVDPKGSQTPQAAVAAAVTVVKIMRDEEGGKVVQFIDGDAEEVTDVEPGETAED
jgi:hypothetical protein